MIAATISAQDESSTTADEIVVMYEVTGVHFAEKERIKLAFATSSPVAFVSGQCTDASSHELPVLVAFGQRLSSELQRHSLVWTGTICDTAVDIAEEGEHDDAAGPHIVDAVQDYNRLQDVHDFAYPIFASAKDWLPMATSRWQGTVAK